MKFLISVYSDDETEIDESVGLLSAADAVGFITDWQAQQEAAQHGVQRIGGRQHAKWCSYLDKGDVCTCVGWQPANR